MDHSDHVELFSHRLSDSDSGLISDLLYSQLSSISSQPSVAELSRPGSRQALQADRLDSTQHALQLEEPGVQSPIVVSAAQTCRSAASKQNGSKFIQEFLAELGNTMDPSSDATMLQNAGR